MEKKKTTKKVLAKEKPPIKKIVEVNPVRTGASQPADGSIILPSATSISTADPLRRSFSEASRSRRRSNGVKNTKKALPKKEKAAAEMETDADTAPQKPVVLEGRTLSDTAGRAAPTGEPRPEGRAAQLDEPRPSASGRERYFEAVGRRKTAVARVRLFTKAGDFLVNGKPHSAYFSTLELLKISEDALQKMKLFGRFKVTVVVKGGGMHAQAEALRQGLSRCLVKFNPDFRKRLRRADFLKRDPRMKERKKPGLKRARKAPQWSKR